MWIFITCANKTKKSFNKIIDVKDTQNKMYISHTSDWEGVLKKGIYKTL